MNDSLESIAIALLRTTLVTSVAAVAAMALLRLLKIHRARTHRIVWLLVLAQGWLLWPYTWSVEVAPVQTSVIVSPTIEASYADGPLVASSSLPRSSGEPAFDMPLLLTRIVLATWGIGVLSLVLLSVVRYLRVYSSGRPGELVSEPHWFAEWDQVRQECGLRSAAELRTTRDTGPLVCWVPWILLVLVPKSLWAKLERTERQAILRHELAHCQRGDLWKNLVVRLLALPQWFNPLVWLAVRRFEEAGEWACDEQVARASGASPATDYARVLLHVADYATQVPAGTVGLTGGQLSRRIQRLIHSPNMEVREMRSYLLLLMLIVIGLFQVIRIERVEAEEPATNAALNPLTSDEPAAAPTPKSKYSFDQPYVIEPPDILLINVTGDEQVSGEHLVGPDGRVNLGSFGSVSVTGCTLEEAKQAVEKKLSPYYHAPVVSVDVFAYNSKKCYVITKHPSGDNVVSIPITGNETVLDAIARIGGVKGQAKLWIDRPAEKATDSLIKQVDYQALTQGEDTSTNFQLLPSDRLFIEYPDPTRLRQALEADSQTIAKLRRTESGLFQVEKESDTVAPPTPFAYDEQPQASDSQTVTVRTRIVTDPKQNLRAIEGLKSGTSITGESQILEGLLGVLDKNDLSKVLATPSITVRNGQVAQVGIDSNESSDTPNLAIKLLNHHSGKLVIFDAEVSVTGLAGGSSESKSTFALNAGESFLTRIPQEHMKESEDIYLLITRE
ncbi:M56 family metallopeptidase [Aeoliella mucimassa]|uniref:Regulatory protein BlaR1 n=1 Tax=Aeoliella mucimassa TaxID=2527972 RepID=A0A518AKX7_9BACT|nr:M56 family metallopeptidase [Aeoliella mucimassa]QDU55388.1 Regulatory protein BlaR1 [Aeoliella mucimassa]